MIMFDYIARKIAGNIFFVKKTLKKEKIKHIEKISRRILVTSVVS